MAKKIGKLVLHGEGDAAGSKIVFDIWRGRARMVKTLTLPGKKPKGKKMTTVVDWTAFSDDEALHIKCFLDRFLRFSMEKRLQEK
jgi:hypothetical protein